MVCSEGLTRHKDSSAEWEKRDPRWIVENRADGTNCNHWHWNEKNLLPWSQRRLDELTKGITADLDASLGSAEIVGVKELTGEAYMLVRKQNKKVAVFELNIVLSWRGHWVEEAKTVEGDIRVKDWSSIDPEEYQFEVSVAAKDSATDAGANLKAAVQGLHGSVLNRLQRYVHDINQL